MKERNARITFRIYERVTRIENDLNFNKRLSSRTFPLSLIGIKDLFKERHLDGKDWPSVSGWCAGKIFPNSSCFISLVLSVIREDENRRKIERCIGKICNSKQNPQKEQMSARLSDEQPSIYSLEFAYPTSAELVLSSSSREVSNCTFKLHTS